MMLGAGGREGRGAVGGAGFLVPLALGIGVRSEAVVIELGVAGEGVGAGAFFEDGFVGAGADAEVEGVVFVFFLAGVDDAPRGEAGAGRR